MNLGPVCRKNGGDIVQGKEMTLIKTVPIKFNLSQTEEGFEGRRLGSLTIPDIINLLEDNPTVGGNNPDREAIVTSLENDTNPKPRINKEKIKPENRAQYESACTRNVRKNLTGQHLDNSREGYKGERFSVYGCQDGTCYLVGFTLYDPLTHPPISEEVASVLPKCNYIPGIVMEDDSVLEDVNGGQTITFPQEIFDNEELFKRELRAAINRTTETHPTYIPSCTKSIHSLYNKETHKYEGIILEPSTYTIAIIQEIADSFGREFDINLKFTKGRGRQAKDYTRYSSISWN